MKLQTQLVLAFNAIVLTGLGVVGVAGWWTLREHMLRQFHAELEQTVRTARIELALDRETVRQRGEQAATSLALKRALLMPNRADDPTLLPTVVSQVQRSTGLDHLAVLDVQGHLLAHSPAADELPGPEPALVRPVLAGQRADFYETLPGEHQARAWSTTCQPIVHLDNVIGVVVGRRALHAAFLTALKTRTKHEVHLKTGRHILLTTMSPNVKAPYAFESLALEPSRGDATLEFGVSIASVQAAFVQLQHTFVLLLGLGALLASWLAIRIARRITAPLEHLTQAVAGSTRDALQEARLEGASSREVRLLVDAYNQLARDLRSSRERLVHSERTAAWRDAARKIAHEIKNPLTPIQVAIEGLRRHRDHPEFPRVLDESTTVVLQEIDRLKAFVNEFAQFARLPTFRFEPMDVNALVRQAGDLHAPLHPHVTVRYDLADLPPLPLDQGQFMSALINLVKNAMEAMPERGALTLRTARAPSQTGNAPVIIECVDTGPGFTPDALAKVFTPYFTTKASGTGLGLAFTYEVVRAHHGTLSVESRPTGTRITIALSA